VLQRTTFMRGKHPVVVARVAEPGTATEPCASVRWALNLEIAKNRTKQAVGPLGRVGSNPTPGA
jgi:hypothetical protein